MITAEQFFYLNATLVTVNGIFVGLLSYRQYRLAQQKLKLDLYDRRFKYWEAVRDLVVAVRNTPTTDAVTTFVKITHNSEFLFGPKVAAYLRKVTAAAFWTLDKATLDDFLTVNSEVRIESQPDYENGVKELERLYSDSTAVFRPYLGFAHIKH